MKAVVIRSAAASLEDKPIPELKPDYILVKVKAVALNPTDWKHIVNNMAPDGTTVGCDYAGVVEAVGPKVTKSFQKGDRIFGVAHGTNYSEADGGVFAEYAVVKGDLQMHIPDNLSFEEACTFPLGATTVAQGLYQKALKLNLPTSPTENNESVLIYGGSSATGVLGIQYAKLSGYHVITTCGKHNFEYVKQLGADAVFDYKDPDVGKKINKYTHDKLLFAWDTISLEESAKICAEALSHSQDGARYGSILGVKLPRDDVKVESTIMYTIFNELFEKRGNKVEAMPDDFEYAKQFLTMTQDLLGKGKLKPCKETVKQGGLGGIAEGLKILQEGKNSGEKLVYQVE